MARAPAKLSPFTCRPPPSLSSAIDGAALVLAPHLTKVDLWHVETPADASSSTTTTQTSSSSTPARKELLRRVVSSEDILQPDLEQTAPPAKLFEIRLEDTSKHITAAQISTSMSAVFVGIANTASTRLFQLDVEDLELRSRKIPKEVADSSSLAICFVGESRVVFAKPEGRLLLVDIDAGTLVGGRF